MKKRRNFDYNGGKDYDALTENCLSIVKGERLEVNIADRNVQSPEGLAVRLNDDLKARGIVARPFIAWQGPRRPKEGKVIVERAADRR